MKTIVVFASGSGTNFQAIIDAVKEGKIKAHIGGLLVDNPDAKAIDRAKSNNIEVEIMSPGEFQNDSEYEARLLKILEKWNTDLIVLAGYLKKIPESVINRYSKRIINIHPALLPKYGGKGFYGMNVHEAVIENNDNESGCTVHYVTEEYDEGPIIAQTRVPVLESDDAESLAKRVLKEEHKLLPKVLSELIEKLN